MPRTRAWTWTSAPGTTAANTAASTVKDHLHARAEKVREDTQKINVFLVVEPLRGGGGEGKHPEALGKTNQRKKLTNKYEPLRFRMRGYPVVPMCLP